MKFEWDEAKRLSNIAKHGIDFRDAPDLFHNPYLILKDIRCNYGEERFLAMGQIGNRPMVLVFTEREEKIRIISLRKANSREQEKYQEAIRNRLETP